MGGRGGGSHSTMNISPASNAGEKAGGKGKESLRKVKGHSTIKSSSVVPDRIGRSSQADTVGRKRKLPDKNASGRPLHSVSLGDPPQLGGGQSKVFGDKDGNREVGNQNAKVESRNAIDDIFGDVKRHKQTKAEEEVERLTSKKKAREDRKRREVNPFAEGGGQQQKRWAWADEVRPISLPATCCSAMKIFLLFILVIAFLWYMHSNRLSSTGVPSTRSARHADFGGSLKTDFPGTKSDIKHVKSCKETPSS